MRDYFEAEMHLLHDAAQEFANANPEQARMLNMGDLRDRDPYIERLLEGVAFLTANIRQRIDSAETALSEQLLTQVCPQQLRPYPSTALVEFSLDPHRQTPCTVSTGVELLSAPVGDNPPIRCRYTTLSDLTIRPLSIVSASAEARSGGVSVIRLDFRVEGSMPMDQLELASLPLHLYGPRSLALALYQAFCHGIRAVWLQYEAEGQPKKLRLGGQELLQPMYLDPDDSSDREGHPGFDLLHDYFCFRDKFLFVNLRGLDGVDWPPDCDRFQLEFEAECRLPPEHHFTREHMRLHCVPAVNLFPTDAEPVEVHHRTAEYRLLADAQRRQEVHVHSVHAVTGRTLRTGDVHDYQPLYALRRRSEGERYFHTFRRDHGTGVPLTYLMIGGDDELEPETLTCRITACNGHLPRQYLHEDQIQRPGKGVPASVNFTNITRPGPLWEPPRAREYSWRLHALLSHNVSALARPEMLRQMLELFEWTGRPENQRRIDGISDVSTRPINRIMEGVLHRGLEVTITLLEDRFLSQADAYLFGQVLHRFFVLSANLNEFVQTRLICQPSYQEFLWAPRPGRNSQL